VIRSAFRARCARRSQVIATRFVSLVVCAVLFVQAVACAPATASSGDYVIHTGDQVQIFVYGVTALNETVPVLPDGTIALPLVGSVQVATLTPDAAGRLITGLLGHFVKKPTVNVIVVKPTLNVVEVLGSVDKGGAIELDPGDRLSDAIVKAGAGPTTHADLNHITINRIVDGKSQLFNVDLYQMLLNGDLASNMLLQPNDLIYVPQAKQPVNLLNLPFALYYLYLLGSPHAVAR
jgi:polysaccharide export outer membrane protein